jgi:hypothetical protein
MNLEHLYTAVELVRSNCYSTKGTETTFLRTYPVMVAAARMPAKDTAEAFLRAACLAHAWMPQTLRLDQAFLRPAVTAFEVACADEVVATEQVVDPIAASLSSVVAASRVLHLANPNVFPFWDERIERFRLGEEPSPYHMGQARNYLRFIQEIRELTAHPLFLTFHNDFCTAYQARLQQLRIPPYPLTEPKVVEAAISELAGGG